MSVKRPAPQLGFAFEIEASSAAPATVVARPKRTRRTWLVHQLVAEARELIEAEFADVWVEGEISNLRPAASGHLYFTLKDSEAQLSVVLFRRQALLLRFRPEDGLHVRVRGKASIYEQRGSLQLVAETMEPVGAGSLQLAFEQLRDRLKAEGLFDLDRKQPLPSFPQSVAVITSPSGAVIRDFLNIVNRRHSGLCVLVVPVSVQGDSAAAEIDFAIKRVNDERLADVIVLARGGGSLEDMAAFNSERVARAIAASELPVVSAVGHETDFTIADFAADLRAPTPSAAAELITEAQHKVEEYVIALDRRLDRAARFQLLQARQRLARLPVARAEQRVRTTLHRMEQRLDDLCFRRNAAMDRDARARRQIVAQLQAAVLHHDPRHKLGAARAALMARSSRLEHALDRTLAARQQAAATAQARLHRAALVHVSSRRAAFANLSARLNSLSPLAVLQRGYALVQDEAGVVVRSVDTLANGQVVSTRLGDGSFRSTVSTIDKQKDRRRSS